MVPGESSSGEKCQRKCSAQEMGWRDGKKPVVAGASGTVAEASKAGSALCRVLKELGANSQCGGKPSSMGSCAARGRM